MNKTYLLIIFFIISYQLKSQDSTLIGRFSVGISGSYSISNIMEEKSKGGTNLQMRYFPTPNGAFIMSIQNLMSQISRLNKISNCINYSLGLGYEKHIPIGNFSPYLGIEAGINFTNVKSNFIKLPANIIYFQQNLPNYLFKPKIGALFKLNDNVFVNLEGSYNWVISLNRDFTNPLYDDSYTAIFFGRKLPTLSIGVHYLFNEK